MDRSFGRTGGPIPLDNKVYNVTADLGKTVGNNLFHSFSQFDVAQGETATFSGPKNIQNILTRVTGGNPSSIDGTIRSTIDGANLFLMNPNGVIFGSNAQLDVSGSFVATTANYLKLADGARFVAALDADDSVLSTAPVASFGFLGNNPGRIAVQGSLATPTGNLSIIGGDIDVDSGELKAPGGQVEMVSVRSKGEVPADVDAGASSWDEFRNVFPQQGQITIHNEARVNVSGEVGAALPTEKRTNRVVIRGGSLMVDNSSIEADTNGAQDGQGVDVAVLNDLKVVNEGQISAVTRGEGHGGDIHLTAAAVRLDGQGAAGVETTGHPFTRISTSTGEIDPDTFEPIGGSAKAGNIVIKAGSVDIVNNADIFSDTNGSGRAGRIEIDASSVRLVGVTPDVGLTQIDSTSSQIESGGGHAGDIIINADTLDMRDLAQMSSYTMGSGDAGTIAIRVKALTMSNQTKLDSPTSGSGKGGSLEITADSMLLTDGSSLHVISTSDVAAGGNIRITTGSLDLINALGIDATAIGRGSGGNITVTARSDIRLMNSHISAGARNRGGNIRVTAGSQIRLVDSTISAGGFELDDTPVLVQHGGNIRFVGNPLLVYLLDSNLSASAENNGGNITVGRGESLVLDHGTINANASVGMGGRVIVSSDFLFSAPATAADAITATGGQFGTPGTVVIEATQVDLSGVLLALPASLLGAESQLREWCGVRLPGEISSFVVLGRGGTPIEPDRPLPSFGSDTSDRQGL